jgi:hypothetical protein
MFVSAKTACFWLTRRAFLTGRAVTVASQVQPATVAPRVGFGVKGRPRTELLRSIVFVRITLNSGRDVARQSHGRQVPRDGCEQLQRRTLMHLVSGVEGPPLRKP